MAAQSREHPIIWLAGDPLRIHKEVIVAAQADRMIVTDIFVVAPLLILLR
jgi:hypothetical protein